MPQTLKIIKIHHEYYKRIIFPEYVEKTEYWLNNEPNIFSKYKNRISQTESNVINEGKGATSSEKPLYYPDRKERERIELAKKTFLETRKLL